jgi:hypothetical protein
MLNVKLTAPSWSYKLGAALFLSGLIESGEIWYGGMRALIRTTALRCCALRISQTPSYTMALVGSQTRAVSSHTGMAPIRLVCWCSFRARIV